MKGFHDSLKGAEGVLVNLHLKFILFLMGFQTSLVGLKFIETSDQTILSQTMYSNLLLRKL